MANPIRAREGEIADLNEQSTPLTSRADRVEIIVART